jgi:hypothetical protein
MRIDENECVENGREGERKFGLVVQTEDGVS